MDTITQGLLGAAVAHAGFRDRLGSKAVLFGAACGLLPDFDVVMRLGGEWASLVHHRGASHSLIVLPLVAPLVGAAGSRWLGERRQTWVWIHLAFWALVTHPLLDLFTTYGTQLFAPLSDARFALDGVAIIDPIFTVPLGIAVWRKNRRIAQGSLLFGVLYLALGTGVSMYARSDAQAQLATRGFEPVAVRAMVPMVLTPLRRIVARDKRGVLIVGWWSPTRSSIEFEAPLIPSDNAAVDAVRHSKEGQIFAWFADQYVWVDVIPNGPDETVVRLIDARYGFFLDPRQSPFAAEFTVRNGRVVRAQRASRTSIAIGDELRRGWSILAG